MTAYVYLAQRHQFAEECAFANARAPGGGRGGDVPGLTTIMGGVGVRGRCYSFDTMANKLYIMGKPFPVLLQPSPYVTPTPAAVAWSAMRG